LARTDTFGGEGVSARLLRSERGRSRCLLSSWIALLLAAALSSACGISFAQDPGPAPTATASATATATSTATSTPTATPPPTSTPSPIPPPTLTAAPRSEVRPAIRRPAAPSSAAPTVPQGTTIVWGGCASDGECHWYNFYWGPTRQAVLQYGEGHIKVQHELCHAHQHLSINGGRPLEPSDYDLESWYDTPEGHSFTNAVAGLPWPWTHSDVNGLEDFAWTCAYWYTDSIYLKTVSPTRHDWAAANLP
jgi:hypothetical protein